MLRPDREPGFDRLDGGTVPKGVSGSSRGTSPTKGCRRLADAIEREVVGPGRLKSWEPGQAAARPRSSVPLLTKEVTMGRLEGKVAVISGGTSGIGLAIAQRFAKEGAYEFIFGRHREALDEAVQLIGANVTAIQADASRLEDLNSVADTVRSAKGKVDVVVSNVALVEQVPLTKSRRIKD